MPSTASTINQKHQLTGWVAVAVMTFSRGFSYYGTELGQVVD